MDIALVNRIQLFSVSSRGLFSLFVLLFKINCSYIFLFWSIQKAGSNSFFPVILGPALAPFAFPHILLSQVLSWLLMCVRKQESHGIRFSYTANHSRERHQYI